MVTETFTPKEVIIDLENALLDERQFSPFVSCQPFLDTVPVLPQKQLPASGVMEFLWEYVTFTTTFDRVKLKYRDRMTVFTVGRKTVRATGNLIIKVNLSQL